MTRDKILRMAIKCHLINAGNREGLYMEALAEFAALVEVASAAAEREACAKAIGEVCGYGDSEDFAAIIRARGEQ